MKRIPVLLNEEQYQALRALAYETHISMSEHVRRALDEYIEKHKPSKPRS